MPRTMQSSNLLKYNSGLYAGIYKLLRFADFKIQISYIACILLISIVSLLDGFTVHISLKILADITNNISSQNLGDNIILFGGLILASTSVRLATQILNSKTSARLGMTINLQLFKCLENREELGDDSVGDYVSAMTTQISIAVAKVFAPIINLFASIGAVFAISIVIFNANPLLALPSFIFLFVAYAVYSQVVKSRLNLNSKKITRGFSDQANLISETIRMRDYRMLEIDTIDRVSQFAGYDINVKESDANNRIVGSIPRNAFELISGIIIIYLGFISGKSNVSPVEVLGFIGILTLILQRLLPQVQQMFNCMNSIRGGSSSIFEILRLLDKRPNNAGYSKPLILEYYKSLESQIIN